MIYEFLISALPWVIMGVSLITVFVCKNKKDENNSGDYSVEGMCLGMPLDVIFDKNIGLGISFGMLIGLVIGSCIQKKKS